MLHSIIEYYPDGGGHKCGYCKKPDSNYSHGMWAHTMTVSDYQDLIDRGWRRCGKYCYKPTMDISCCPMYTIRCITQEFKVSKSQKKVLKKLNLYLKNQELIQHQNTESDSRKMSTCGSDLEDECLDMGGGEQFIETDHQHKDIDVKSIVQSRSVEQVGLCEEKQKVDSDTFDKFSNATTLGSVEQMCEGNSVRKGLGADLNKAPCKKAKQLRRERKLQKLQEKGLNVSTNNTENNKKQLEDFINELPEDVKHKLEIKLVRTEPPSLEWLATAKQTHELYVKYQMKIHGDKLEKCTERKFQEFLVQSPLIEEHKEVGPPSGYGSFHQQYWVDSILIAVGVIDILPKCVSSVYFFYDPLYSSLTLGTFGALREIAFTRQLNKLSPEIKYYYLGFYIHSCRKMRYKGNYHPSELLCPETYKWFPIKDCIPKLDASPYSRLNPDIDSIDENSPNERDVNDISLLVKRIIVSYKVYKRKFTYKNKNEDADMLHYAQLVGAKAAKSLILVK